MYGKILAVCLATLCIAVAVTQGRPHRGGRDNGRKSLLDFACSVTNASDPSAAPVTRQCGCQGETGACTWGPVTVTGAYGESLSISFCDMSTSPVPGVVGLACSVTFPNGTALTKSCGLDADGVEITCSGPTLAITTPALTVQFCPQTNTADDSSSDSDDDSATCVSMSAPSGSGSSDSDSGSIDNSDSDRSRRGRKGKNRGRRSAGSDSEDSNGNDSNGSDSNGSDSNSSDSVEGTRRR